MIQPQADDHIAANAVLIVRIVQVSLKTVVLPVEIDQPATIGADPDVTGFVFNKAVHVVERKAVLIRFLVMIMWKLHNVPVQIIDTLLISSQPNNSIIILIHGRDGILAYASRVFRIVLQIKGAEVFSFIDQG